MSLTLASIALLAAPGGATAANSCDAGVVDKTWVGTTSDWNTASNWTPSGVPGAGQDACVPSGAANAPVVDPASGTAVVGSIESFKAIQVAAGRTLRVTQTTGQASLLHDTLTLGSNAALNSGGTLNTVSHIFLGSNAELRGPGTVGLSGSFLLPSGPASVASTTTLSLGSFGAVSNNDTLTVNGELELGADAAIYGTGTTVIAAGAEVIASAHESHTIDTQTLQINGAGHFEGEDGPSPLGVTALLNGARIAIGSGGTLDVQGDHNVNGGGASRLDVQPGGTLTKSSGVTGWIGTPLDNDGVVSAAATATLFLTQGSPTTGADQTSVGQFRPAAGGTVHFLAGSYNLIAGSGPTFAGAGTVIIDGAGNFCSVSLTGAASTAPETTLVVGSAFFSTTNTTTVNGALALNHLANIGGLGTMRIGPGGTLSAPAGSRTLSQVTLRIDGTGTFGGDGGTSLSNGAKVRIRSGGTLDLQDHSLFDLTPDGNPRVQVDPGGKLMKSAGIARDFVPALDNRGTVEVAAGEVALTGDFANYDSTLNRLVGGAYVVRNGARLMWDGADVHTNAADITLDGPGSRLTDGGTPGEDALRNLDRNASQGSLRLRGGHNFNGNPGFVNDGLIDLGASTTLNAPTYDQNATGELRTMVAGPLPGATYGQLTGLSAHVDGTLRVSSTYAPQTSDLFDVVSVSSRSGTFDTLDTPGFDVGYLSTGVRLLAPSLTITDVTEPEGNAGSGTFGFRVNLSSPSLATVAVDYKTVDVNATAGDDYDGIADTLTLDPGETTASIDVPVHGDLFDEPNERFRVLLSGPQFARVADGTATGTILNDDPTSVSIADSPDRAEGGRSRFVVSLSNPSSRTVRVGFVTKDGTAVANSDYVPSGRTLRFLSGQTTKAINVATIDDGDFEPDESFVGLLFDSVNATIADDVAEAVILDND